MNSNYRARAIDRNYSFLNQFLNPKLNIYAAFSLHVNKTLLCYFIWNKVSIMNQILSVLSWMSNNKWCCLYTICRFVLFIYWFTLTFQFQNHSDSSLTSNKANGFCFFLNVCDCKFGERLRNSAKKKKTGLHSFNCRGRQSWQTYIQLL